MTVTNVICITNILRYYPTVQLHGIGEVIVDKKSILVGNSAVTARCRRVGTEGDYVIKCYYRDVDNLGDIYPNNYYPEALFVYDIFGYTDLVDVVMLKWFPGESLDKHIYNPECNFRVLSHNFDAIAALFLDNSNMHGDITAQNIIVQAHGEINIIDSIESNNSINGNGTEEYNNPLRAIFLPNKHVDEYAIAIISSLLAALAIDRTLLERITIFGALHIDPYNDFLISHIAEVLKDRDDIHYNILQLLENNTGTINGLSLALRHAVMEIMHDYDTIL